MLFDLIQNFVLGFGIAAIPGVVFFETIRRTLTKNSFVSYFITGNVLGVSTVAVLAFAGASALLTTPSIAAAFYIGSGSLLLWIGLRSVVARPKHSKIKTSNPTQTRAKRINAFLTGYTLAVTNPINMLFWISLMGTFIERMGLFESLANAVSVLLGTLALLLLLAIVTYKMRSFLKPTLLLWLTRIFGLIIAGYGAMMIVRGIV